jgi:multiple antibiotic resistance protein
VFQLWILPIISIFFIVDPLAVIPSFLTLTADDTASRRRRIALKASIACTLILAGFASAGGLIFRIFGITLPAFRIAGGLLLFVVAFEMVLGLRLKHAAQDAEQAAEEHLHNMAAFPLAIPMMAGPGAITATILLAGQANYRPEWLVVLLVVVVTVIAACFFCFAVAEQIGKVLGVTGNVVMSRLLGVILAALAVQYVVDGARAPFGS